MKDFYPSIDHAVLCKQIKKSIKKKEILECILKAIKNPTANKLESGNKRENSIGVPQGLSISNILANIYFFPIDNIFSKKSHIKYFRYVDDILILCKCENLDKIRTEIELDCSKIGLKLHGDDHDKSASCSICDGFSYLGYLFNDSIISVRKKSIDHLRESIIKLFTNYKYSKSKDLKLLKWTIDLRITGCILNETKYGWLFFFSQINDLQLLKSLDQFINKLIMRFKIDPSDIAFKKFTRSFHEITKNLTGTKYIPNFDNYSISQKKRLLKDIFGFKTRLMKDYEIKYQFNRRLYKTVKDLEKDLARAS